MEPRLPNDTVIGARSTIDGVVHFDATAVRRGKMRENAQRRGASGVNLPQPLEIPPPQTATPAPTEVSILDRPGVISLAPLGNVALAPSPHGPLAPAARRK